MIDGSIIKVLIPATAAFVIGILFAPILTRYLYKYKVWKKTASKISIDGTPAVEFEKLRTTFHTGTETSTPRMGGVLIWYGCVRYFRHLDTRASRSFAVHREIGFLQQKPNMGTAFHSHDRRNNRTRERYS